MIRCENKKGFFVWLFFVVLTGQAQNIQLTLGDDTFFIERKLHFESLIEMYDNESNAVRYSEKVNNSKETQKIYLIFDSLQNAYSLNEYSKICLIFDFISKCPNLSHKQIIFTQYSVLDHYDIGTVLAYNAFQKKYLILCRVNKDIKNIKYLLIKNYSFYPLWTTNNTFSNFQILMSSKNSSKGMLDLNLVELPKFQREKFALDQRDIFINGEYHTFKFSYSSTRNQFIKNYPELYVENFFTLDADKSFNDSLDLFVKKFLINKNTKITLEYFLSFTRQFNKYQTDKISNISFEKPYVGLFLESKFNDCEDFSSFGFYLLKRYTKLPILVLQYKDHINLAVHFKTDEKFKNVISYKGKKYVLLEFTNPTDNIRIGESSVFEKNRNPEVILYYPN